LHRHERCSEILAGLGDYLDGSASEVLCAEIERHLADCPDCSAVVNTTRKLVLLYRNSPPPALPPGVRARLHMVLRLDDLLPGRDGAA
jgi:predicted anti-sigma-YlaC factor YlaD